MNAFISTRTRRWAWTVLTFFVAMIIAILLIRRSDAAAIQAFTGAQLMTRLLALPAFLAAAVLALTTACAVSPPNSAIASPVASSAKSISAQPFVAQVVGLQWLNPLQRKDYPTEWQILWTLGLVRPNEKDLQVLTNPKKYSTLQPIGIIAYGNEGRETFDGYHDKYIHHLFIRFHDIYFSSSDYFYNAHSKDKKRWRELAGIHVEYALPSGRLDPLQAGKITSTWITDAFEIGNVHSPTLWSRNTPPDVRITMGGANAGFTSLSAALDYLQTHPAETVWAMNWDAPSFPPDDEQINENMVLLVLAGADYKTEREPLAWLGYPATQSVASFEAKKDEPPTTVQAWKAAINAAATNANKQGSDIGYAIHDAGNKFPAASNRIGALAQTLTTELPGFDFAKQTFNTPGLLGEMGAGTALTNVALAIGYANHFGKNVLVAGTTDYAQLTALVVVPPAKVRPIDPTKDWFRARGGNHAFLPWWGLRRDAPAYMQGYSD